jgi:hypothetical protein
MNVEYEKWQKLKNNYLKQVEHALASIDHPKSAEVLHDVNEHLERKYADLPLDKQNWEGYQQILIDMGPPQDYAELLCEQDTYVTTFKFGINQFLAIIFVIVLAAVGSYLVYNAKMNPSQQPVIQETIIKNAEFELDERVLGQWTSVDFVKRIEDFDPAKKKWQGQLYLKGLDLQDKGVAWWFIEDKKYKHHWTKGKVNPLSERPAFYYLRSINGNEYLFFEWISGDVTLRGREPSYYVLKRTSGDHPGIPDWFENDPCALGYWVVVDFVKNIEAFKPEYPQASELFLKTLHFKDNGELWWTIGNSKPIRLDWTKGTIRPFGVWPADYSIQSIQGKDYLFYQYRISDNPTAGYYVFQHREKPEHPVDKSVSAFVNDPQVLGKWISVDFVENPDVFQPNQQSWRGELWVKKLDFKEQGIVEWCLGEDQMKIDHHWTKGLLNPDDDLPARYSIEKYPDGDYLFMEWNSGDVTIRGQKPSYYVLKKAE